MFTTATVTTGVHRSSQCQWVLYTHSVQRVSAAATIIITVAEAPCEGAPTSRLRTMYTLLHVRGKGNICRQLFRKNIIFYCVKIFMFNFADDEPYPYSRHPSWCGNANIWVMSVSIYKLSSEE